MNYTSKSNSPHSQPPIILQGARYYMELIHTYPDDETRPEPLPQFPTSIEYHIEAVPQADGNYYGFVEIDGSYRIYGARKDKVEVLNLLEAWVKLRYELIENETYLKATLKSYDKKTGDTVYVLHEEKSNK